MFGSTSEKEIIARLVRWADRQPLIRALILTSSRANPAAPVDILSDYDLIVVVTDLDFFARDDSWLRGFGRPLVMLPGSYDSDGMKSLMRLTLYDDGVKVDYSVWPVEMLQRVLREPTLPESLDVGYRVLVDKDNQTHALQPPTYRAHIPARPTAEEFYALVEEFWWETGYVAKNLWRDELMQAKYNLDFVMKTELLRKLLEWRIEIGHDWSIKPGALGRELKKHLDPHTWDQLAATYVGADLEENWQALFRTTALFRRVALEVGHALGYTYPDDLDQEMTRHLQTIRNLPR